MKRALIAAAAVLAFSSPALAETYSSPDNSFTPGMVIEGGSYKHITTQTTTLIKGAPGLLHTICVNTGAASATATVQDALTNTTPTIAVIDASAKACYTYDLFFAIGLTIVTAAGNADITVTYH